MAPHSSGKAGLVASVSSWPTYHGDNLRSGFDAADAPFRSLGSAWSAGPLDGLQYAAPIVVGTTVLAATENNTVYAFTTAGGSLWHTNLGAPVPASSLTICRGNVDPVGITSTPVADPVTNTIFVVALLFAPNIHYELAAIRIADGVVLWRHDLTDTGFDPTIENQRGALTLANNNVYVPFGGRAGDCGDYKGWVMSFPASGTGSLVSMPLPTGADHEGGLWQPSGGSVDASGNLYYSSGNTSCGSNCNYDYGESVIKFSPTLTILDWFFPANWEALNASDTDIGSTGPLLLPGGDVFQVGKSGDGYLLSQALLGGAGHQTPEFSAHVCPNQTADAAFGGDAFDGVRIYVPCTNGVVALTYDQNQHRFAFAWQASGIYNPPIVAGGFVWVDANGSLYGLAPDTGQMVLTRGLGGPPSTHFGTPAALNSQLFVPAETTLVGISTSQRGWNLEPGAAHDVAAGGGKIFALGTNPVAGGDGIWAWTGTGWSQLPGGGVVVAVDKTGAPWVANDAHQIWRWDGSNWHLQPGSANYVAAGDDGSVYALGTDNVNGGHGIWRWNGSDWSPVDGGLVELAVGKDGSLWGINSFNGIFRRPANGGWTQMPGSAHDVSAADVNTAWVTGTNPVPGGYGIWAWSGGGWNPLPGGAVDLAVDAAPATPTPWAINSQASIYTFA